MHFVFVLREIGKRQLEKKSCFTPSCCVLSGVFFNEKSSMKRQSAENGKSLSAKRFSVRRRKIGKNGWK